MQKLLPFLIAVLQAPLSEVALACLDSQESTTSPTKVTTTEKEEAETSEEKPRKENEDSETDTSQQFLTTLSSSQVMS